MDKYTFKQLDEDTRQQIMLELCDIGQRSVSWGEIAEIESRANEWLAKHNEPKTYEEWQELTIDYAEKRLAEEDLKSEF